MYTFSLVYLFEVKQIAKDSKTCNFNKSISYQLKIVTSFFNIAESGCEFSSPRLGLDQSLTSPFFPLDVLLALVDDL